MTLALLLIYPWCSSSVCKRCLTTLPGEILSWLRFAACLNYAPCTLGLASRSLIFQCALTVERAGSGQERSSGGGARWRLAASVPFYPHLPRTSTGASAPQLRASGSRFWYTARPLTMGPGPCTQVQRAKPPAGCRYGASSTRPARQAQAQAHMPMRKAPQAASASTTNLRLHSATCRPRFRLLHPARGIPPGARPTSTHPDPSGPAMT